MTHTLSDVRAAQPGWFSRKNKRFFGDISYRVLHGKVSRKPYLVRSSYTWSDMFGQPRRVSWHINRLNDDLTIGKLVQQSFRDLDEVKEWLQTEVECAQ